MAIVMIQGPGDPRDARTSAAVETEMSARARRAGLHLEHYRCDTQAQLLERLARIDQGRAQIILLDPGRGTASSPALCETLEHLHVPYIEVHEDSPDRPEPLLPAGAGTRVAVVNGYAAQSHVLAMSLALERLGHAEAENEFSVGT